MGQEDWYQYASGGGVGIPLVPWSGVVGAAASVDTLALASEFITNTSAPTSTAAAVRIQARVFTKSS
jgi:hypothetical protein